MFDSPVLTEPAGPWSAFGGMVDRRPVLDGRLAVLPEVFGSPDVDVLYRGDRRGPPCSALQDVDRLAFLSIAKRPSDAQRRHRPTEARPDHDDIVFSLAHR